MEMLQPQSAPHAVDVPVAPQSAIDRAAELIARAQRPLVMLGAAASRPRLAEPLSTFVRRMGIPFFNTQMGKGAVNGGSNLYMSTYLGEAAYDEVSATIGGKTEPPQSSKQRRCNSRRRPRVAIKRP